MVSIRPVKTACQWAKTALCAIWAMLTAISCASGSKKPRLCRGKAGYHFANTSLRRQFGKCELVGVKLRHFACAKTFCRSNIPLGCLLLAQTRTCRGAAPPSCYRKTVLSLESPTGAFIASLRFANANLLGPCCISHYGIYSEAPERSRPFPTAYFILRCKHTNDL